MRFCSEKLRSHHRDPEICMNQKSSLSSKSKTRVALVLEIAAKDSSSSKRARFPLFRCEWRMGSV